MRPLTEEDLDEDKKLMTLLMIWELLRAIRTGVYALILTVILSTFFIVGTVG